MNMNTDTKASTELAEVNSLWVKLPVLVNAAAKDHFTPIERRAVFFAVKTHGEKIFAGAGLLEEEWCKFRGIGKTFISKIRPLGWVQNTDAFFYGRCRFSLCNILNLDYRQLTKAVLKKAIEENRLAPGKGKNYGLKAHQEVCSWVGTPPIDNSGRRQWKFDPFTGKPFRPKHLAE